MEGPSIIPKTKPVSECTASDYNVSVRLEDEPKLGETPLQPIFQIIIVPEHNGGSLPAPKLLVSEFKAVYDYVTDKIAAVSSATWPEMLDAKVKQEVRKCIPRYKLVRVPCTLELNQASLAANVIARGDLSGSGQIGTLILDQHDRPMLSDPGMQELNIDGRTIGISVSKCGGNSGRWTIPFITR